MKLLTASAAAVGLSLMAMSASQAVPLAPLDQSVSSDTIRVAGGCGPGWHRGPYGGCRPMYNCPPGWHSGPFVGHLSRQRFGELGVLAHLWPQRFRCIRFAGRVVIVGAHDEQRRSRDERNFVHHGLAIDHLRRADKGAQPARIFRTALDVEARVDERRD